MENNIKFEKPVKIKVAISTLLNVVDTSRIMLLLNDATLLGMYKDFSDNRTIYVCSEMPVDDPMNYIYFEVVK